MFRVTLNRIDVMVNRFLPESVPWLISKGRLKEAERIILQSGSVHCVQRFPSNICGKRMKESYNIRPSKQAIKDVEGRKNLVIASPVHDEIQTYTLMDVLRHRKLRRYLFIISLLWSVIC